ncbi:hypothetical protein WS87_00225 (plasmid) [Burkholderia sp. MSMB0856]|uniref:DUF6817 domain-containing protein n=1 Tax=Burkholderia sp. MSMB0856 TaxID=1637869 RepID=UPI00085682EF|nr:hypothetical protein [Burkholderia sp. MSMB0856]AOJ85224.1 hypothetical protein WS87_00225 [Burkholderia sp. MSMB0856]
MRDAPIAPDRLNATLVLVADAMRIAHSGSTLWDHLLGTYEVLSGWGADPDTRLAGLIHSIYSTQYFHHRVVEPGERVRVAMVVGQRVEALAHAFCVLDRDSLRRTSARLDFEPIRKPLRIRTHTGDGELRVSVPQCRALRLLDLANEAEQRRSLFVMDGLWLSHVCEGFQSIGFVPRSFIRAPAISHVQERRLTTLYKQALAAPCSHAPQAFRVCIQLVPECAEPRFLLAALRLQAGDFHAGYMEASTGIANLDGWGAPWDARIPVQGWRFLGEQLTMAARATNRNVPDIYRQILHRIRQ